MYMQLVNELITPSGPQDSGLNNRIDLVNNDKFFFWCYLRSSRSMRPAVQVVK